MTLHSGQPGNQLRFPVDFLDVVVHLGRQLLATLRPAIFQDFATTTRLHSLAESMHANATPFLGLVGAFWHSMTSFKKRAQGAISHQTSSQDGDWHTYYSHITVKHADLTNDRSPQLNKRKV
jgi:hypothetical protein